MSLPRCEREDELLDALGRGYVDAGLEAHVASCAPCTELRVVAGALLDDRAEAIMKAPVPSAGTTWFRMLLRERQEAQAKARRSVLIVQAVTLAVAMCLTASLLGADIAAEVREVIASVQITTPALLAVAIWLILPPLAGYVAIKQK